MPAKERTEGFFSPELETMDPQAYGEYLDGKVAEIVAHAFEHAPAFTGMMKEIGAEPGDIISVEDLSRLPITEKTDLVRLQRQSLPFGGLAGEPFSKMRRIFASPGPIYEPCEEVYEDTRWTQAFCAAGFRPGDIAQITFNFNMVPFAFMLDEALHMLDCLSVPTGVGNSELQVQIMRDLGVHAYVGTPSFLAALADKAEEMGLDLKKDLNLKVAFVAAEMLPESLRSSLQERMDMLVRQSYGTAELNCLSYECHHMGGMHFAADCVVEVVDPQTGRPVGEGEIGEVVATIFNKTYPLIRLGTGDLSSYTTEPCPCGRTLPKLTRIMGRVDQVTKVKGMFVHPAGVQQVTAKFPEIRAFQLVVDREGNTDVMTLVCELAEECDQSELQSQVEAALKEMLRVSGRVDFCPSGTLPEDCKVIDDRRIWD